MKFRSRKRTKIGGAKNKTKKQRLSNINEKDNLGDTALIRACKNGSIIIARGLIDQGAGLNIQNNLRDTALTVACSNGDFDIVTALIQKPGIRLNIQNDDRASALMIACYQNHPDIAVALINRGANLDILYGNNQDTVLMIALQGGRRDASGELNNHDINTSFNYELQEGHRTIAMALIDNADENDNTLDFRSDYGLTALIMAFPYEMDIANALLDKGADPNGTDADRNTPLHRACIEGNLEVVNILIDRDADLNRSDNSLHQNALEIACNRGHIDIATALLMEGCTTNEIRLSEDGQNTLEIAQEEVERVNTFRNAATADEDN